MINKIREKLRKQNLDGMFVSREYNISYLTGFKSCEAYLLVSEKENIYWTDARYIEQVRQMRSFSRQNVRLRMTEQNGSVFDVIFDACRRLKLKRIGFEAKHLSFSSYQKLKDKLKGTAELVPTEDLIEGLRQIKTEDELVKIEQAVQITGRALNFVKDFISPGKKEIEIVGELERFIRYNGAANSSFEIIVASGINSSFPHHIPDKRIIRDNELVLVDIGVEYQGYKSDLTRVFFLGKITPLVQRIYHIVLGAQQEAIERIRPGVLASEIDKISRGYIEQKGFGKYFSHSLGHGVGLEVHEAPRIAQKTNQQLQPGMVFTIEPAIYLKGKFGIRIEDMVLVTKKGIEVISGALNK